MTTEPSAVGDGKEHAAPKQYVMLFNCKGIRPQIMINLLMAFLLIIGIILQIGCALGGLKNKEKFGAFVVGFFLEASAGLLFYALN